ncbi:MAG: family 78 glycoside hydrolase catalytic domain [Bacteroidales bacterium]|nr:family 78 glycoside hydrolase catalytic domain [Bacteroidales bacterium]
MKHYLLLFAAAVMLFAGCGKVEVEQLRVEQLDQPLNIETQHPRLSWVITSDKKDVMQTAYHILVASSPDLLEEGKADMWDSRKVESDASVWVPYEGLPLKSNQRLYWTVKVYTTQGNSEWSKPAEWGMGLLTQDEWQADWIGLDQLCEGESLENKNTRMSARYLRKEFLAGDADQIKRAVVHVSGLGSFLMYINGERIGNDELTPGPTDWRQRVFYNTYDLTNLINDGNNAIGVVLGSGRYVTLRSEDVENQEDMFGMPKLRLQMHIEYADGTVQTICSDTTWRITAQGPIRANNEYDGEEFDARMQMYYWSEKEYDDSKWQQAQLVSSPMGIMMGNPNENITVKKEIPAVKLTQVGDDRYIVDFGQNLSGWEVVKFHGLNAGDTVTMRFAEILKDNDSNLYTDNLRSALATDRYIANGDEKDDGYNETWHPAFVIHGFRYMEIKGVRNPKLEDFSAELVFDDLETTGEFETSNDILNAIFRNAWWGIADNYRGMPLDCCQRDERMPWLGDRTAGCYGESYVFGNGNLYAKWMTDICQSQEESGSIPSVCPTYWRIMSSNMTWPAALPMGCDMLYQQYGNIEPMRQSYDYIKRWLAFMMNTYMDGDSIITKDTFGDWCMPSESQELIHSKDPARITSGALMSTAYYVKISNMMAEYAPLIDHADDVAQWQKYAADLTKAFNKRFLHVVKKTDGSIDRVYYDNNTATANVLPLAFGMVPDEYVEAVRNTIVSKIMNDNNGHVSCGVVGMSWIQRELSRMGRGDIAFLLASNTSWPSYGYMIEHGATTIWELWNGDTAEPSMNSGNHVMLLGDLITWFFKDLAGIQNDAPGFKTIRFAPDFSIADLQWVKASYRSLYGTIESNYRRNDDGKIEWTVTVPCNTTATVVLPDGEKKIGSGKHSFKFSL